MKLRHLFMAAIATTGLASLGATSAQQPAGVDDGGKVICKKEAKTGTRHHTKTCHTKAQWDAIRIQNQRDLKEMADRPEIEDRRPGRGE